MQLDSLTLSARLNNQIDRLINGTGFIPIDRPAVTDAIISVPQRLEP